MKFRDSKGNKVTLLFDKEFTSGSSASIHLLEKKTCLKKYFASVPNTQKILEEEFKFLKSLNHDALVKLEEYFFDIKAFRSREIEAYTYGYIDDDGTNVLYSDTEFFIEAMRALEELVSILSDNKMCLYDLKVENTIVNASGIVLLDPDRYRFRRTTSIDTVRRANKYKMLVLIRALLYNKLENNMISRAYKIEELLPDDLAYQKEMVSTVGKRLSFHKKVVDFIR